jgi:sugar phosphate isomerase/epimerase
MPENIFIDYPDRIITYPFEIAIRLLVQPVLPVLSMTPKIALRNIFSDVDKLWQFSVENGFTGIDWNVEIVSMPNTPAAETRWVNRQIKLNPLEIRYHCPFKKIDIGHEDPEQAKQALTLFRRIIRRIAKAGGKYLTIHVGLGHDSTRILSWNATIDNLQRLVQHGSDYGVKICLENLAWGWTSKPNLFEKLIRKSGASVTFDIGHAHACEVINSQYYTVEDFVTPHPDRVLNAHIYHTEIAGTGHVHPDRIEDIDQRLDILQKTACNWWVIELNDIDKLLQTKKLLDNYLTSRHMKSAPI